ncbi:MAG: tetratricopeptide repeat protein [Opitutaceae bacterium]
MSFPFFHKISSLGGPTPPGPTACRWTTVFAGVVLALAAFAVYANSFSGPFIFDDLPSIPGNPSIRSLLTSLVPPGGGATVMGRPVLNFSFALNHAISGDRVWSYHALNLLIHVLAGLTLFGVVRRAFGGPAAGSPKPAAPSALLPHGEATFAAFAAALLWMVHPLQTESVTYIVQRAESLMGLFYLLTLYCFIRGADRGSGGWFALSILSCLLGMGTKEVMVSAPLIVLLYDRGLLAGTFREAWRRRARVHLALAATWIPLTALVLHTGNRGGTSGLGVGVSFWSYGATQFQALSHYLLLSVWPHPLIVDYGVKWVRSAWEVVPYAAGIVLLVGAALAAFVRRPALGFLGASFFAILSPTSLVPGGRQTLAEHRMYLPLAPVIVLAVLALYAGLGRRARLVIVAAAIGLGWLTIQRNLVYRSDVAIWRDVVTNRPSNAYGHNNYGNILARTGRPAEAMAQYEEAIRLGPNYAAAYANGGNALAKLGRFPEAIAWYERALKISPDMPDAETELGIALDDDGRGEEAAAHYEKALRLDPKYTDADNRIGLDLARTGRLPAAIARYEKALRIDPDLPDVRNNLGNALLAAGRTREAVAQFEQALRLKPDFAAAHNDLGNVFRETGRLPDAIAQYEAALKFDPGAPRIRNNLGISLLMTGRAQEAITQFERALRLNPNLALVHRNLAIALASVGRSDEAAAQFEAARRLGAADPALHRQ